MLFSGYGLRDVQDCAVLGGGTDIEKKFAGSKACPAYALRNLIGRNLSYFSIVGESH